MVTLLCIGALFLGTFAGHAIFYRFAAADTASDAKDAEASKKDLHTISLLVRSSNWSISSVSSSTTSRFSAVPGRATTPGGRFLALEFFDLADSFSSNQYVRIIATLRSHKL